jgi:hypothetical protein
VTLIVGQGVADVIAADQVNVALKAARADAKRARDRARRDAAGDAGGDGTNTAGAAAEAVDGEAQREQARAQRAVAAVERERCAVFNDEFGVAIVNSLSRVTVDDRTVKIVTAVNVAGELDRIAMRGARYGFPGWVTVEEAKRGAKRRYIEQRSDAEAKAIEYLEGAKTAGELAGRTLALLVMAGYAQEGAVAQSARAFHGVAVHSALPWAGEVPELIDELAAEKLPAALMDPILSERRARHEQHRAAAAAKAEAEARVDELQARIEDLAVDELDELERLADLAYGEYTSAAWRLRDAVRARRRVLATPPPMAPARGRRPPRPRRRRGPAGRRRDQRRARRARQRLTAPGVRTGVRRLAARASHPCGCGQDGTGPAPGVRPETA